MFRREVDGADHRYSVAGLWGSGNVVVDREGLSGPSGGTAYSMWDGHALYGPGRPGRLEKYPVLLAKLPLSIFLERHGDLGGHCRVWTGREELGVGCEAACDRLHLVCEDHDLAACLADCAGWPRAVTDCFSVATDCESERLCGREAWDLRDR